MYLWKQAVHLHETCFPRKVPEDNGFHNGTGLIYFGQGEVDYINIFPDIVFKISNMRYLNSD